MGTDPFDEFEFKPLTDGLGFHNQKASQSTQSSNQTPSPIPSSPKRSNGVLSGTGITFDDDNLLRTPLPRKREAPAVLPAMPVKPENAPSAVDDILNTLKKNRKLEIEMDRKARQELRNPNAHESWKTARPRFSPMFLDGLLVTAISLLSLIVMLMVTKVDLIRNLTNPDADNMIYVATMGLFVSVCFIYTVAFRVFLGYTPGEWAYDMRLGRPQDQQNGSLLIRMVVRQILLTVTGIIPLPLIGSITGFDIAGAITGTQLMRKA